MYIIQINYIIYIINYDRQIGKLYILTIAITLQLRKKNLCLFDQI